MNELPVWLGAVDFQEIVFVIVFLVVGFINWVINLIKQKREAAERGRQAPTDEELETRRRVLEEQQRPYRAEPETPYAPLPAPAPAPQGGDSLKDLFEELKRAAREAQGIPETTPPPAPRPVAPPLPSPARPPQALPAPPALPAHSTQAAAPWVAMPVHGAADDRQAQMHTGAANQASAAYHARVVNREAHPLTAMLHTAAGYRQAFVLKEILDTPKGIRGTPWDETL